jgi:IS4 transposase
MWFDVVAERFAEQSPCCLMLRATLEHVFPDSFLNSVFADHAQVQYQKQLLFSTVASLLTEVVFRVRPSIRNAFLQRDDLEATLKSTYEKLQHTETAVCEALVDQTAQRCHGVLDHLPDAANPEPIPGLHLRVVDGNFLAGTEHRLLPLRGCGSAALPGMTLALRDHASGLISRLLCREDAHTNERSLVERVLDWLAADDLIVADRNFCTLGFFNGLSNRDAFYLIRHHQQLHLKDLTELQHVGRTATGEVYEKQVRLGEHEDGPECRCVVVKLDVPTQDGETEVVLLTNVAKEKADAILLAETYLLRWRVEHAFQVMTDYLRCEVDTLGYPKAALLGFSLAVCAYNLLAVLQGTLAQEVGRKKVEEELSVYEVAEEVSQDLSGMQKALPEEYWERFGRLDSAAMANWLRTIASGVCWDRYRKAKRSPRKARPTKVERTQRGSHRATARVLAEFRAGRARAAPAG